MRPNLEGRTEELIQMFLDRNIYKSQTEVIQEAMELLVQKQIELDSRHWDEESQTPESNILSQTG